MCRRSSRSANLIDLEYPEGYRFFAVEIDRATETIDTLKEKFACYSEIIRRRLFAEHWGIRNLSVMFVTTAPGRIETLRKLLEGEPYADRFLFAAAPDFGVVWTTPRALSKKLFDEPCPSAGKEPFHISKAKSRSHGLQDICEAISRKGWRVRGGLKLRRHDWVCRDEPRSGLLEGRSQWSFRTHHSRDVRGT